MRFTEEELLELGYDPDMLAAAKAGTHRPKPIETRPGARVLTTRLVPDFGHTPTYAPGETIVRFRVETRPVPWSVAHRGQKPPKLADFQARVHDAAVKAMGRRPPHAGPVTFQALFRLTRRGAMPDLTNVEKASEDALQVVASAGVILDDQQVLRKETEMDPDAIEDSTEIRVLAYEPRWIGTGRRFLEGR